MSIQGNDGFLDLENASLRVTGNVHAEGLKVGSVRLQSAATLQSTTVSGNTTTQMVQFTNPTKGFDVTSNIEVGDANLFVDTTTGRVGVGTNAPMGTLDVKGVLNHTQVANVAQITSNSNVVMEYKLSTRDYETKEPRIALTANSDRGYVASASSSNPSFPPNHAFDNVDSTFYHTDGTQYVTATGAYQGSNTLNGVNGEWLSLQLPNKIDLSSVHIYPRTSLTSQSADSITIVGSNDGSSWTTLTSVTGLTYTNSTATIINVNSNTGYKYFAIIAQKVLGTNGGTGGGAGHWALTTLELYGTGDNGTANVATGTDVVLHTTPNVPKTDFSNVYYDGQDYTSMPATVADKSGNGVTGTPSGGVGFDTTYKAFTFDGVDDKITATLTNPAGAWVHSTSSWFKINSYGSGNAIYSIDNDTTPVANQSPDFSIMPDGDIRYAFGANDIRFGGPGTIVPNKWYHIVSIYSGGSDASSRQVFLNGVELGQTDVYQAAALNGQANMILRIGVYANGSSYLNGSIANFRLYNQALSADEIWELYAYQKEYFGVSPDVVTLKAGRVGIGTSEPRAVLDVRGDIRGGCPVFFQAHAAHPSTATTLNAPTNPIPFNTIVHNKGGGLQPSGVFTCPLAGYYYIVWWFMSNLQNQTVYTYLTINGQLDLDGTPQSRIYGYSGNTGDIHNQVVAGGTVYMNVGDELRFVFGGSTYMYIGQTPYNSFTGFYISS
jgi:hypothetical protein